MSLLQGMGKNTVGQHPPDGQQLVDFVSGHFLLIGPQQVRSRKRSIRHAAKGTGLEVTKKTFEGPRPLDDQLGPSCSIPDMLKK